MSSAIPTMTSMVTAAPAQYGAQYSQYAAQPTMTSMYATPGASMYMPAGATTVAPQSYVAAGATTMATQSYVAAPQQQYVESFVAAPQQVQQYAQAAPALAGFNVPQPQNLTAGLPAPAKISAEAAAYSKALDAQLAKQSSAVMEEAKIKKLMLEQQAKTQVAQAELTIDEALKMDVLRVDQEAQNMLNGLKEAAITQGTAREETCAVAVADYNKKQALETMDQKSYALQKQWFESETKLMAEYQKITKGVTNAGYQQVVSSAAPQLVGGASPALTGIPMATVV